MSEIGAHTDIHSIEDNILVTATGHENLTTVPREADELEALILGN